MKIFSNFRDDKTDPMFLFLKEKYGDLPITFWYDRFPVHNGELTENPYNILFLHEPNEFFGLHSHTLTISHLFTAILTWGEDVLNKCPNGVRFTYNGQTLDNGFIENLKNTEKKFNTSFICGKTKMVSGHKLRHIVYKLKNKIKDSSKWFYVLDDYDHETDARPGYDTYSKDLSHIPEGVDPVGYGRRILFEDSMFNIAIENVNHNNWYNKIGDNFLTKTIPIYWGCPNISDFGYDERGIIRFKTTDELINILSTITPQMYKKMKPYIDYNYKVAKIDTLENKLIEFFENIKKQLEKNDISRS